MSRCSMNRRERRSKKFSSATDACIDVPKFNKPCQKTSTNVTSQSQTPYLCLWEGSYNVAGTNYRLEISKGDESGIIVLVPVPLPDSLSCLTCGSEFDNHSALKYHLKRSCLKKELDFIFFCDQCHDKFATLKQANKHVSSSHNQVSVKQLLELAQDKVGEINISSAQLDSVLNDAWLGDETIDVGLLHLALETMQSNNGCLKVFPASCLFRDTLLAFAKGKKFGQQLFYMWFLSLDFLLIPVNHNRNHWSLLIVDNRNEKFLHCDSIPHETHNKRAKWIAETYGNLVKDLCSATLSNYAFEEKPVPVQSDGHNCGVHVIMNAQSYITGRSRTQSRNDCRGWRQSFVEEFRRRQNTTRQSHPLPNVINDNPPSHEVAGDRFKQLCYEMQSTKARIIRRIPKGSRAAAAIGLSQVLNVVCRKNDEDSWIQLFKFARSCFYLPDEDCDNLTKFVKDRILLFQNDQSHVMPSNSASSEKTSNKKPSKKKSKTIQLKKIVSQKLSDADIKGAVRVLSSTESMAPKDSATLLALQKKHPDPIHPCHSNYDAAESAHSFPEFNVKLVRRCISTFQSGSAGGVDGLLPQHLKDLSSPNLGEVGGQLLQALKRFSSLILTGQCPEWARSVFFGARLLALKKKDGGIRPIAVGCTLRRLCSKLCNSVILTKACDDFSPRQLGFGMQKGAEAAIHSMRQYTEWAGAQSTDLVFLKIDFANAFNSISRDHLLKMVEKEYPEILAYVRSAYSRPSGLFWGDEKLLSKEGVQQGDPMGPFLFCLGIQIIVRSLKSPINLWYMDDGSLAGPSATVIEDFEKVIKKGAEIGLFVNHAKCELFLLGQQEKECQDRLMQRFQEISPGVRLLHAGNLVLLGATLNNQSTAPVLQKKLDTFNVMCSRLRLLDRHDALFLLRNCFALPKLMYLLRTSPCFEVDHVLRLFDSAIVEALKSILNCDLSFSSITRATLPIHFGGLGVRKTTDVALPAFISSCEATADLQKMILTNCHFSNCDAIFTTAVQKWNDNGLSQPTEKFRGMQKAWGNYGCEKTFQTLIGQASSQEEQAVLKACADSNSGAWLRALPSSALGLKLPDDHVRVAAALRVGAPVGKKHNCVCGKVLDGLGHHALSCGNLPGRRIRHTEVNGILNRALCAVQVPSVLEPPGLLRTDQKRPDGMTLIPWEKGLAAIWDYTCPDTVAPSNVASSSSGIGKTAANAEAKKMTKYKELVGSYIFYPIAIETMGSYGPSAKGFIKKLGKRLRETTGDPRSSDFFKQRLSLAVQRGNCISVLSASSEYQDPLAREYFTN